MCQLSLPHKNLARSTCYLLLCLFFFSSSRVCVAEISAIHQLKSIENSSLLLLDSDGMTKQAHKADRLMIPASTMKILTALLALNTWGSEHRFNTDFILDENEVLWIKGLGDPFLISEEIDLIVNALKNKGLIKINGIGIDNRYFSKDITINGQSATDNPYDAAPGALVANFNTINITRKNKQTYSAEPQTPLTQTTHHVAGSLPTGTHRISLKNNNTGSRYFAEILVAKLSEQKIQTTSSVIFGKFPDTQPLFYHHINSHDLSEIVSAMLKYSNNFIANQLFLLLGIHSQGAPATIQKSQTAVARDVEKLFGWQTFSIIEGAGLSRDNRLSSRQLIDVLQKFLPYRTLLSQQSRHIFVKSGTLKGVSTYAGYLFQSNSWIPFALMINQSVKYNFRKRVAQELLEEEKY